MKKICGHIYGIKLDDERDQCVWCGHVRNRKDMLMKIRSPHLNLFENDKGEQRKSARDRDFFSEDQWWYLVKPTGPGRGR